MVGKAGRQALKNVGSYTGSHAVFVCVVLTLAPSHLSPQRSQTSVWFQRALFSLLVCFCVKVESEQKREHKHLSS